jgi:threonine dehydratase
VKRDGITALGATIDTSQPHYDAAMDAAKAFAAKHGATYINPCLGEMLLAGQGTVALEILGDLPGLATLVVNVGGGGLLGGCATIVRGNAPSVKIFGAQSVNTAAMSRSLAAGRVVEIENVGTLADGLAGQIDDDAFDIGRHALDDIVTLTEDEIAATIGFLWREHHQRVEGAGACAAGAVWTSKFKELKTPVAVVISGGNIDPAKFDRAVERWNSGTVGR